MSTIVRGWCSICRRTGTCDHIQQPKITTRGLEGAKLDARERTKASAPVLLTCPVCGEDFVSSGDLYCGGAGRCTDGIDVDALAVTLLKLELAQATAERLGIREGEQLHEFIARLRDERDADPAR